MNNYERLEAEGKIKGLVYNLCTNPLEAVRIMYKIPKNYSVTAWLTEPCAETYDKISNIIEKCIKDVQTIIDYAKIQQVEVKQLIGAEKLITDRIDECLAALSEEESENRTPDQDYFFHSIKNKLLNLRIDIEKGFGK